MEETKKGFPLETGKVSLRNLKRVAKELCENMTDEELARARARAAARAGYVLSKVMFLAGEIRAVWGVLSNPLALIISIIAMRERRSGEASASASSTLPLISRGR